MSKIELDNKYFEIISTSDVFKGLFEKSFPVKMSYQLSIILKEIENLSNIYFEEKRKLILKHSIKDDNQNPISNESGDAKFDNPQEFMEEFNELLNVVNTLNAERILVDLEELDKKIPEGIKLNEINILKPLIEIE